MPVLRFMPQIYPPPPNQKGSGGLVAIPGEMETH